MSLRFADARLAGDEHHLAFARLCPRPAPQQRFEFLFPPDQRGQVGHVQGVKAAFDGTRPQRGPGPRRPGDTLEILGSEIPEFEEIAEQLSRAVGDHDHVRLGQRLQARRQVRRVADDATFLRISRSDQVTDHDEPSGDADAHLQRSAGSGLQHRHRLGQREPGNDGSLGVMLVGLGIAEISQHAVAHILGDEPPGLGDLLGAATVIGADDLAHILGVKPRRKRGRAHEVAEHHRELAALGGIMRLRGSGCRSRRSKLWRAFLDTIQLGYRAQQLTPMTERGHP